jgi:hypothetical protein
MPSPGTSNSTLPAQSTERTPPTSSDTSNKFSNVLGQRKGWPGLGEVDSRLPPTPPMSSNSACSTASSASASPQMTATRYSSYPSMPCNAANANSRGSFQPLASVTNRSDVKPATSPLSNSPTNRTCISPILVDKEVEEESDFLSAVLQYASSANVVVPPTEKVNIPSGKVLTQEEAKRLLEEKRKRSVSYNESHRSMMLRSVWTSKDANDSDDEYGNEDEDDTATLGDPDRLATTTTRRDASSSSSVAKVGLDTAAKKALYACTITKFHPKLAVEPSNTFADVRLPRSTNSAKTLETHSSSYSHTRSMRIGVARAGIIRRLKSEQLPLSMEQELGWFVKKYLPHFIPPEQLVTQLQQRTTQSNLEALVRPPLDMGNNNGMAVWATRKPFHKRCQSILDTDSISTLQSSADQIINKAQNAPTPMPLQLSKRCRALAGLPEEVRKSVPVQERKREAKPSSNLSRPPVTAFSPTKDANRRPAPWDKPPSVSVAKGGASPPASLGISTSPKALPASFSLRTKQEESSEEEEDVPLAKLMNRRIIARSVSESNVPSTADDFAMQVRQKREAELAVIRTRELKLLQDQKRLLTQARERRANLERCDVQSSRSYGAKSHGAGGAHKEAKRFSKVAASDVGVPTSPPSSSRPLQWASLNRMSSFSPSLQSNRKSNPLLTVPSPHMKRSSTFDSAVPTSPPLRSSKGIITCLVHPWYRMQ